MMGRRMRHALVLLIALVVHTTAISFPSFDEEDEVAAQPWVDEDPLPLLEEELPPEPLEQRDASPSAPSQPRNVNFRNVSPVSAIIFWTRPSRDGGSPLLGYRVLIRLPNGTILTDDTIQNTTYNAQNLSPSTNYSVSVSAFNSVGYSPNGSGRQFFFTRPPTIPDRARNRTVSSITYSSAVISWLPPAFDGGSPLLDYLLILLEMNYTAGGYAIVETLTDTTYSVSGLRPNTTYLVYVWARNAIGYSNGATGQRLFKTNPPESPDAVPSIEISEITSVSFLVSWTEPLNDGGSPIIGYVVYVESDLIQTSVFVGDSLHYTMIYDLYPSSQYGIWVYALNAVGFRNRDPVYATTGDPEPPSPVRDLSVTDITETGAIVTWSHPVTQGTYALQTYRVYVEWDDGGYDFYTGEVTSGELFDLPSDTNITVTVTARSSVGYSESRSIHFTTLVATATVPAPVTNLAFSFLELYSLMLTWSVPVDDGNSTILGYQIALRNESNEEMYYWFTNETSFAIEDLQQYVSYTIAIYAQNSKGFSDPAGVSLTVPESPTEARVSNITSRSAILTWSAPSGGTPAFGYQIVIDAALEGPEYYFTTDTDGYLLEGLQSDAFYRISVYAQNIVGFSDEAASVSFTTLA